MQSFLIVWKIWRSCVDHHIEKCFGMVIWYNTSSTSSTFGIGSRSIQDWYIVIVTECMNTCMCKLTLCMLENCSCFCCWLFSRLTFLKIFQEHYQSVKRFGSRSSLKAMSQTTRYPTGQRLSLFGKLDGLVLSNCSVISLNLFVNRSTWQIFILSASRTCQFAFQGILPIRFTFIKNKVPHSMF